MKFYIVNEMDAYDPYLLLSQTLKDEHGDAIYEVYDLHECPEDAVIGRELVSAERMLDFIKYGINLGVGMSDKDCGDIEVIYVDEEG